MERIRKPLQGIYNIIRFNRHFYFLAIGAIILLVITGFYLNDTLKFFLLIIVLLITCSTFVSLLVSFYIYDVSGLYKLSWLNDAQNKTVRSVINIHAGFDETSVLLQKKFPDAVLNVLDFYNPVTHTELSIKRARKLYAPYPGTQQVHTSMLPLRENSVSRIFLIFAAHEIRDGQERIQFFEELRRVINFSGEIFVTEHLRDVTNFLAYNIGFFHFYPRKLWLQTFSSAGLYVKHEIKITPFITTFILTKNGDAL